jgi:large subunit ribosomal protein L4
MPVVDVKNLAGKTVGTVELADDVFGVKPNQHLLHEAVRHYLAGQRAGTHKTKDKSEVSGSGRKLWKQKGTGRARVGSIRSPLWRHGGTVHGPTPRKYDYALPKKMVLGALRSALSAKLAEQQLTVLDSWELDSHKTKPFASALGKLHKEQKTCLIVEAGDNVNLERASRNIDGVTLVPANGLEAYDLMRHTHLVVSRDALAKLNRALSATKPDVPVQIEAAPAAKHEAKHEAKHSDEKHPAKKETKSAKKPAAKKETKAKSKPKAKKG